MKRAKVKATTNNRDGRYKRQDWRKGDKGKTAQPERRLYRRATACALLDCAPDMMRRLEKAGKLRPIRLGTAHVFYAAEEVEAIARGE
jgi:hypothetical protein